MKYLLRLSLALAIVVLLLAVAGFFLPGSYRVERSKTIVAPPAMVFGFVSDLSRWKQWGVWYQRDKQMTADYSPVSSGKGAVSTWRSQTQGNGRMEVTEYIEGELIKYTMTMEDMPLPATGTIRFVATEGGESTIVTWTAEGDLGMSPISRWFGKLMDKLVGGDFDKSLSRLKTLVEESR